MAVSQRLRLLVPVCVVALGATAVLETGCGGGNSGGPGEDAGTDTGIIGDDSGVDSSPPDSSLPDSGTVDSSTPADSGPLPDGSSMPDATVDAGPPALGPATRPGDFTMIFDAVPDPTGATIYFTGIDASGNVGVFSVPVSGAASAFTAVSTTGYTAPIGIAISADGATLYVADVGNDSGNDQGGLYSLPVTGGAPTILETDREPRGLTVAASGTIYFTGLDATSGLPGVFSAAKGGGAVTVVAEGPPFVDPSGITLAANGDLYVADTIASGSRHANIIRVSGGTAKTFIAELYVGYPSGLALVQGDTKVVLSGLDPATALDSLTAYDTGTAVGTPYVSTGLGTLNSPAGLHRALNNNVFAWVDSPGDGTDAVHVIK